MALQYGMRIKAECRRTGKRIRSDMRARCLFRAVDPVCIAGQCMNTGRAIQGDRQCQKVLAIAAAAARWSCRGRHRDRGFSTGDQDSPVHIKGAPGVIGAHIAGFAFQVVAQQGGGQACFPGRIGSGGLGV